MLIDIRNLTFSYDGSFEDVFNNASFSLDTDWRLGLIGRNGRGKTTLLRLLCGEFEYKGTICAPVSFDMFPFTIRDTSVCAFEALFCACSDVERWRVEREMASLSLDFALLDRRFSTLSGGERTKLMLAALFSRDNKFLLIDEPTNHLDIDGREAVSRYLSKKSGFILVSHDRAFLDGCIDHVMSIDKARITVTKGNFSTWKRNKDDEDKRELAQNELLKRDIKRLEESRRRTEAFSAKAESEKFHCPESKRPVVDRGFIGAAAARLMKKSKNIQANRDSAIEDKQKLLKNIDEAESLKLFPLTTRGGYAVRAKDLAIDYGNGELFAPLTFAVKSGERVALYGINGSGKSSVLKLICGENVPHTGGLYLPAGLSVSYVPQDASWLKGDLDAHCKKCGVNGTLVRTILRKLGFSRSEFARDTADYSAGQKKKVLIAVSLATGAQLYVWDEPLNYIDLPSRIQIEELICEYRPTLLIVEHDKRFLSDIEAETVVLARG